MSWQGLNPVDDDLDGFADTLPEGRSVGLRRPFRAGGLPPRFSAEVGPLLRYLDREGLAYDLTTGEIEINSSDKSKSTGVMYPMAKISLNKEGEIQFDLFQNPWDLTNIIDWMGKAK